MVRPFRSLLLILSKLLSQSFRLCWLVPLGVSADERIVRAIYSPYHVDKKKNRLKHQAYDPTPRTDEISIMRLDYMGSSSCRRKARSIALENAKKEYCGFAVLRVNAVCNSGMSVVDSRNSYCGHGDIKLLMQELLRNREPNEPLPAETLKRFRDLKDRLLMSSNYVSDPSPTRRGRWRGAPLEPPPSI